MRNSYENSRRHWLMNSPLMCLPLCLLLQNLWALHCHRAPEYVQEIICCTTDTGSISRLFADSWLRKTSSQSPSINWSVSKQVIQKLTNTSIYLLVISQTIICFWWGISSSCSFGMITHCLLVFFNLQLQALVVLLMYWSISESWR